MKPVISTNLKEDRTLQIFYGDRILAEITNGREDNDFVEEILNGMGYIWNEDGTLSNASSNLCVSCSKPLPEEYRSQICPECQEKAKQLNCPLGGDETNDCADCFYSADYHYENGECVLRKECK